jgi:hypothetical protein
MDSRFFFEVKTPTDKFKEIQKPIRMFTELNESYQQVSKDLKTILNSKSELKYIWNKFDDPFDTIWFFGKYFLQAYFSSDADITGGHCFLPNDFLTGDNKFITWLDRKAILKRKKFDEGTFVTLTNKDNLNYTFLENPIVKNNLITEGPKKINPTYDFFHCGMVDFPLVRAEFPDEDILYLGNMHILKNVLPKCLKKGGKAQFTHLSYSITFEQEITFLQVLKLCFEKVIVFRTKIAIGLGFLGVPQEIMNCKYIEFNKNEPLQNFMKDKFKNFGIKFYKFFIDGEYQKYFRLLNTTYLENKELLGLKINNIDKEPSLFSLRHVGKIENKVQFYVKAGINQEEGSFLYNLVFDKNLHKCLEIGMANGISSIYICTALKKLGLGILVSIDPFQTTQWKSNGLELIADYKVKTYHKLIQKKSFDALPELLKRNEKTFDLVFIDGWHTFDYTLVDIFFAVLLMKIGGYMIVDDALHPGVQQTLEYINKNYTMLKKISSPKSFGAYEKISDDTRDWNFHIRF